VQDGVIEKNAILGHKAHVRAQGRLCHICDVLAVHEYCARGGVVESEDQPQRARLAAACSVGHTVSHLQPQNVERCGSNMWHSQYMTFVTSANCIHPSRSKALQGAWQIYFEACTAIAPCSIRANVEIRKFYLWRPQGRGFALQGM
jgi:hypothetical protein